MKQVLVRYKYLFCAIACIIVAIAMETIYFDSSISQHSLNSFQKTIHNKISKAETIGREVVNLCDSADFQMYERYRRANTSVCNSRNVLFYVFYDETLAYWSDNSLIKDIQSLSNAGNLLFSGNAWYLVSHTKKNRCDVFVLSFIKSQYSFENEYIKNEFQSDFSIHHSVEIFTDACEDTYPIYDENQQLLFSLATTAHRSDSLVLCYVIIVLYFFGILFFLLFCDGIIQSITRIVTRRVVLCCTLVGLIAFRLYMIAEKIPYIGYTTVLFDSAFFSTPFFSSLGDLLIDTMLFAFAIVQVARFFANQQFEEKKKKLILLFCFSATICWIISAGVIQNVMQHTDCNLKLFNILTTNGLSFVVYGEIALILFLNFVLLNAFFVSHRLQLSRQDGIVAIGLLALFSSVLSWIVGIYWILTLFFILSVIVFGVFVYSNSSREQSLKYALLLLSVFFVEVCIAHFVKQKDIEAQKQFAKELATEQDPIAESFLTYVYKESRTDDALRELVQHPENKDVEIRNYLQKKYFNGVLEQYNLECTVCGTDSSFDANNQLTNCERFFSQLLLTSGEIVSDSNYYYINNQDGTITYFDSIEYKFSDARKKKLYIELHSEENSQNFGYPTILLNGTIPHENSTFSSAKYKNGLLISKRGKCPYSQKLSLLDRPANLIDSNFYVTDDVEHATKHVAYRINEQFTVVVSARMLRWDNYLIWFPYIFLYFLLLNVVFNKVFFYEKRNVSHSLSAKIKHSFVTLLLSSFLLLGIFGLSFMNTRMEQQQRAFLQEKVNSLVTSLSIDFMDDEAISDSQELDILLSKLAEIYSADINFYNLEGELLASSRPEIFQYRLQDKKMDPASYNFLINRSFPQYTHEEKIGDLTYMSAYVTLYNGQNKVLGYVNLPNFSNNEDIHQQFAGLIVSLINVAVILILLATLLSVFIAQRIAVPLKVIQTRMKQVTVGSENEKITINAPEELEGLVANYNIMIDQLSVSANKLAKAERESAWKEMARQIAHEIKNPLTPMKLSMQLLNRSWDEKDEKFEKRLKSISKTMIEQIDTLAETATSFSDFAKLSTVVLEPIDIVEVLQNSVTLFAQEENVIVESQLPQHQVIVMGDKDKTTRMFNNLIKNAIQAIPTTKQGYVNVRLITDESNVTIAIQDNGRGIDEETRKHIFELHFTTKETGSGFGLAICKNIVESSNGSIWYESTVGEGSTFFVKLPLQKV